MQNIPREILDLILRRLSRYDHRKIRRLNHYFRSLNCVINAYDELDHAERFLLYYLIQVRKTIMVPKCGSDSTYHYMNVVDTEDAFRTIETQRYNSQDLVGIVTQPNLPAIVLQTIDKDPHEGLLIMRPQEDMHLVRIVLYHPEIHSNVVFEVSSNVPVPAFLLDVTLFNVQDGVMEYVARGGASLLVHQSLFKLVWVTK